MSEPNLKEMHIKILRSITQNWVWNIKPYSYGHAWTDLLLLARPKRKRFLFNGNLYWCNRGQFVSSIEKLSIKWGWSRNKVRHFFSLLKDDNMLATEPIHNGLLLTIVNYNKHNPIIINDNHKKSEPAQIAHESRTNRARITNESRTNHDQLKPISDNDLQGVKDSKRTAKGQQKDSKRTAKGQQKDTINKELIDIDNKSISSISSNLCNHISDDDIDLFSKKIKEYINRDFYKSELPLLEEIFKFSKEEIIKALEKMKKHGGKTIKYFLKTLNTINDGKWGEEDIKKAKLIKAIDHFERLRQSNQKLNDNQILTLMKNKHQYQQEMLLEIINQYGRDRLTGFEKDV
jgi:hypothetical protein